MTVYITDKGRCVAVAHPAVERPPAALHPRGPPGEGEKVGRATDYVILKAVVYHV